jgi:hypothetical protein
MKAFVKSMSSNPGVRPREIYITLQHQFPTQKDTFTARDIGDYCARLQKAKTAGFTATQAMLKVLKEKGYHCRVRYTKTRRIDGQEVVEVIESEDADN